MMDVLIRDIKTRIAPSKMIGSGGEAEIFAIGGGEVAKIFKSPTHADFSQDPFAVKAARDRIAEHQKKLRLWPSNLPREVVGPTSLIQDVSGKKIIGYTMQFLSGMEVLLKYGERKYREANSIDADNVVKVFQNLHSLVQGVHSQQVVIGDFNDLNVLVDSSLRTFLVDTDSMQFGGYMSRVFTARFVDPLLCNSGSSSAELAKPHNQNSDWYAFSIMLMQSLLFVGPYGGVHTPSDVSKKLKEWQRVQKRVTVFDSSVRYPKPAWHYSILPDNILDYFHKVFEKDVREEFPMALLGGLRFTTCSLCGKIHARSSCPDCQPNSSSVVQEVITQGIEAMKILDTSGRIIFSTIQKGIPRYVYYENGAYYRDGGRKILDGNADPEIRFRVQGDATVLAKSGQGIIFEKDGSQNRFVADLFRDRVTVVDANMDAVFAFQGADVRRFRSTDMDYADTLGNTLSNQTMIWVGDKLGFVFSRAGGFTQLYVFHTAGSNLGKEVEIGRITGQVLDATAIFSRENVWFLIAIDENGQRLNRAYMFDEFGKTIGQAEALAGDGSWLGTIRGKCANGNQLFCPTDDGVVRIEAMKGILEATKIFTETTRFVNSASKLLFAKDGIYTIDSSRIWRLRMKG